MCLLDVNPGSNKQAKSNTGSWLAAEMIVITCARQQTAHTQSIVPGDSDAMWWPFKSMALPHSISFMNSVQRYPQY